MPEPLRALSLAEAAGCALPDGDDAVLRIRLNSGLPAEVASSLGEAPFVVFHPGAAVPARRPTAERSARMVAALVTAGYRVVVTGADDERALTAKVAAHVAVDLGGRTGLGELAAVFAAADAVVVPNTGPAHLAAAVGTPVVSLFAPVVPASQWSPHGRAVTVLGDQAAPCRATRARQCPISGHPCLDGITDVAVLAAVHQWVGEP